MAPRTPPEPPPTIVVTAPLPATDRQTDELQRRSLGQRRVNLIWELTQATIALAVTLVTLIVAAILTIRGDVDTASFLLLSNAFFLVIGFYFGRTNHQKVGGIVASGDMDTR